MTQSIIRVTVQPLRQRGHVTEGISSELSEIELSYVVYNINKTE